MLNRFFYRSYKHFYRQELWRQKKVTPQGIVMLILVIASTAFGMNIQQNMTYQIMTFLSSILLFSIICSIFFRFKGSVIRSLPDYATVDEELFYKITVKNKTKAFQESLVLFENVNDPSPGFKELLSSKEPYEHLRNRWDRKTLYFRWRWLILQNKKALFKKQSVPKIPPHSSVTFSTSFLPKYRGYVNLTGLTLAKPDPFGLFNALFTIKNEDKLLILPKRYNLPSPDLPGSREYHSGGVALASSIGNSEEFLSLRNYRPGDPIRNIHWKSWAKTDELIIKEHEDEYFIRHALILDTYLSDNNNEIFEEAVSIAASYVTSIGSYESILDLMFVGTQAYCFSSGRGISLSDKMLEILACVKPFSNKSITDLMPKISEYSSMLSGSICIFLDWDKDREALVNLFIMHEIPLMIIIVAEDKDKMKSRIPTKIQDTQNLYIIEIGKVEEGFKQG